MLEDRWSWKRFSMLVLLTLATEGMTAALLLLGGAELKKWVLFTVSGLVFSLLLALSLEWERMEQGPFAERANNFVRICITYGICCAAAVIMWFLPEYARPVMLVPVAMTMVSTSFTALLAGMYIALILSAAGSGSFYVTACYLLLCGGGCVLARYLRKNCRLLWGAFMIVAATFCFTAAFSAIERSEHSFLLLLHGIGSGCVTAVLSNLMFSIWNDRIKNSRDLMLTRILSEDYELAQAIKAFSKADYAHARKVSKIAGECARAIEADEKLAAAAGFYYRVGRMEGEPYVENGLELARKHRFPPELMKILGEYNGEKYLPSTVESALVHIVDHVVAKFDVLDSNTLSSSWNQDIVVYQTLNENSARGLYDKSGLSMNLFLLIRDYLIKEASLYDDNAGK